MEITVTKPEVKNPVIPPEMPVVTVEKIAEPEKTAERPAPRRPGRPRIHPLKSEDSTGADAGKKKTAALPKKLTTPPDFGEWSDFLGTIVFRWATRAFIVVAFRGIDRNIIEPEDKAELELDDEQLEALAKPFAHIAVRSNYMTKHGRLIIDSKDGIEALVILFMWMNRVTRVARKYKPRHAKAEVAVNESVDSGENVQGFGAGEYARPIGGGFN